MGKCGKIWILYIYIDTDTVDNVTNHSQPSRKIGKSTGTIIPFVDWKIQNVGNHQLPLSWMLTVNRCT